MEISLIKTEEFSGISKNLLYGNAYLDAYLDSIDKPKWNSGLCRILSKNIEDTCFLNVNQFLSQKKVTHLFLLEYKYLRGNCKL